jgi:FkbM family methyltransferase
MISSRSSLRALISRVLSRGLVEGCELLGVLKCPELTGAGKFSLLVAKARYHAGVLDSDAVVDCRVAKIRFGRESFPFDWYVFHEVFIERIYGRIQFYKASVLDLGAHKGYFAVFALSRGATSVVSFEPEAANFRRLAATAGVVRDWTVRREAVAGESGLRTLKLRDAWSHTLVLGGHDGDAVTVPALSLADVLGEYPGGRQVVKLDIEGAEYEALAGTPHELLARVDELVVEAHADGPFRPSTIVAIAEAAGLCGKGVDLNCDAPVLHFTGPTDRLIGPVYHHSLLRRRRSTRRSP